MKVKMLTISLLIGFFMIAMISCASEDRTAEETEQQLVQPETIFENEFAKAVRVVLEPGQKLATHEGVDRLIYSLTDYTIDWIVDGESKGERNWSEGDIHVHEPDTHAAINTGTTPAVWMAFARKSVLPESETEDLEQDVTSLDEDFAEMLFDDELFRVTKITLSPGAAIPPHEGTHRIIFSLSDYTVLYESDETGERERSFEAGDVHWHEPGTHSLENTGDEEAQFLVIAYK